MKISAHSLPVALQEYEQDLNLAFEAGKAYGKASCEYMTDTQLEAGVNEWFADHNLGKSFERRLQAAIKVALDFKEKL